MKNKRESGDTSLAKILALGVTFFMVALCPNAGMAISVFASGIAVFLFLGMF